MFVPVGVGKEIICLHCFFDESDIGIALKLLPIEEMEHMRRVAKLVELLVQTIGSQEASCYKYANEDCSTYGSAAFYHDIGKALIPIDVLLKTEKLTKNERILIRKHPLYAKELFIHYNQQCVVSDSIWIQAFNAAVYHHEWWDKNGYPCGLGGTEIPLIARITALCDVYDAITNNRPYRKALTHEYACREIEKNAEIQFDPHLARLFLKYESVFAQHTIHERTRLLY